MKKEYLFTVCIPAYNSERFLEEAVESVIGQSLGFENNIQLVFVNDGSTDRTEDICLGFKSRYPDNIVYISQENRGVSAAINRAIQAAEGRFFALLGSDDLWSENYLEKALLFFEDNNDDIDLVSIKIKIFGDRVYDHPMNYKYSDTRIIDITAEPSLIQTTSGNVIFKTSAIKDLRFDENVRIHEDILFNTMFLMERERYGVISDAIYYYRKLDDGSSLSADLKEDPYWYTDIPEIVYMPLIERSIELYGYVTPYVQEVLLYANKWRLKVKMPEHILDDSQQKRYLNNIRKTVECIDDDRIMRVKGVSLVLKSHLLGFKYGENAFVEAELGDDGKLRYKGKVIYNFGGLGNAKITDIEEAKGEIIIKGNTSCRINGPKASLICKDNKDREYEVILSDDQEKDVFSFNGERLIYGTKFEIKIPKKKKMQILFFVNVDKIEKQFPVKISRSNAIVESEADNGEKIIIENRSKYNAVLEDFKVLNISKEGLF